MEDNIKNIKEEYTEYKKSLKNIQVDFKIVEPEYILKREI